eukprot:TRINITY_DN44156_c0_g1_i1.p1 TRINITY_DN44156_c0_g1~~TRINITY_DN44156_c0_g1_i1.p1  ORF type:complete len:241 (+),score=82.27 TRINITY_DN44156_c0_g1_i1:61-783(+)
MLRAAVVCAGTAAAVWCAVLRRRPRPRMRLLIHNIQSRQNIGNLVRIAVAFDAEEIIVCNKQGRKDFATFGAHGSQRHAHFRHVMTLRDAKEALVADGFDLVGVEITPDSRPLFRRWQLFGGMFSVSWHPFTNRNVCFVMGNEGQGLGDAVKRWCDWFVVIPQYGSGTASLNVATACAVVLNEFGAWAGWQPSERVDEKYVVASVDVPDGTGEEAERVRRERREWAEAAEEADYGLWDDA